MPAAYGVNMAFADEPAGVHVTGPIEETFKRTLDTLHKKLTAENLGEEGFTSSLLGGLTCMFSEVVRQVPCAKGPIACSWGSYSKRGIEDPNSEAASGADSCLVIFDDQDNVRLAMFQAKRAEKRAKPRPPDAHLAPQLTGIEDLVDQSVNIHERPKRPAHLAMATPWRASQAIVLSRAATCIAESKGNPNHLCVRLNATAICPCNSDADVDYAKLHWVHYLIYTDQAPACSSFSRIPAEKFRREAHDSTTSNVVRIKSDDQTTFINVALSGLAGRELYWLPMKLAELKGRLPTLLAVMHVYVADDKTGGRFAMELSDGLQDVVVDFTRECFDPLPAATPSSFNPPRNQPKM